MALEGGQLVQYHHLEGQLALTLLHQPHHVLTVDNVEVCLGSQRLLPLSHRARDEGACDALKVFPLLAFLCPDILSHVLRCNDQTLADGEVVEQVLMQNGQRGHCFAEAHIQEQPAARMLPAEV